MKRSPPETRSVMALRRPWLILYLVLLAGVLAGCGAGSSGSPAHRGTPADTRAERAAEDCDADGGCIEVPDVVGADGADAVSSIEAEGLTASLADATDDPSFDATRDASGCDTTDQDPQAGDTLIEGDPVTIMLDCRQVDWESRDGTDWQAFNDAYTAAFDDGCDAVFADSPTGSLYEDDREFTSVDCQNLNPGDGEDASDLPQDVPEDPAALGSETGELDGCQALFEQEGVHSLNYGENSVTENDCPITPAAPAPRTRKPATPPRVCDGRAAGRRLRITRERGKINCTGALALVTDWLRRAPNEGMGSAGVMTIDGWECAGASASEAPRVGSCSRSDELASFSISER